MANVVFSEAIEAFKRAKTISFSASITNEEAMILQMLKEKHGYKLVCDEAFGYSEFLKSFSSTSGKSLYSGTLGSLDESDGIIVLGSRIEDDNPIVTNHLSIASKHQSAKIAYMHPIEDARLSGVVTQFIKYEIGSEEGVAALLASYILKNRELPSDVSEYLDSLDVGNLSAESNVGEEELDKLLEAFGKNGKFSIVVGSDIYAHHRVNQIAKLIGIIDAYSDFEIIAVPPSINALGVSLVCTLDAKGDGDTIRYGANCDLDTPTMEQQQGTICTIDKQVVAINASLPYEGYTLNDIANSLGLSSEHTIDYTAKLPIKNGFSGVAFDDLSNGFDMDSNDIRGYLLNAKDVAISATLEEPAELSSYDGAMLYNCNSRHHSDDAKSLRGSAQFAQIAKIADGSMVEYKIDDTVYVRVFKIDPSLKGSIALNPTFDMGLSDSMVSSYRYNNFNLQTNNKEGAQ